MEQLTQEQLDATGKVIAVHLNYPSRAAQRGRTPEVPSYFLKPATSLALSGANLERQVAEDRAGLYGDAIETGREQRDNVRVTSHTSVLKDWQSGMRVVYPARWWREVRRMRLTVSWDTP